MAARAVCESPPAIRQPVALDNNNNIINTMIAIGTATALPASRITKPCRNDSAQATGGKGIISSTHTANPSRVPSAMPFVIPLPHSF